MPSSNDTYKKAGPVTGFTLRGNGGLLLQIVIPITVRIPEVFKSLPHDFVSTQAIWDTGATGSVIDERLAKRMGLPQIGMATVQTAKGSQDVPTFSVDVVLNNQVRFLGLVVSAGDLGEGAIQFLVGMDIVAAGDSVLMQEVIGGKPCTVFSFRYPSLRRPVDFVAEINRYNTDQQFKASNKILRKEYNEKRRRK